MELKVRCVNYIATSTTCACIITTIVSHFSDFLQQNLQKKVYQSSSPRDLCLCMHIACCAFQTTFRFFPFSKCVCVPYGVVLAAAAALSICRAKSK